MERGWQGPPGRESRQLLLLSSPLPPLLEPLAICLLQHKVASQVCSLLTRVGLLHVSIGQIVIDLPCPSHVWALCRVRADDTVMNKANCLPSEPHSAIWGTNKDANRCTSVFRLRWGLVGAAAQLKRPSPGVQGKPLSGSVASALPTPSVETWAHALENEEGEIWRDALICNALISAFAFYLPHQLQRSLLLGLSCDMDSSCLVTETPKRPHDIMQRDWHKSKFPTCPMAGNFEHVI